MSLIKQVARGSTARDACSVGIHPDLYRFHRTTLFASFDLGFSFLPAVLLSLYSPLVAIICDNLMDCDYDPRRDRNEGKKQYVPDDHSVEPDLHRWSSLYCLHSEWIAAAVDRTQSVHATDTLIHIWTVALVAERMAVETHATLDVGVGIGAVDALSRAGTFSAVGWALSTVACYFVDDVQFPILFIFIDHVSIRSANIANTHIQSGIIT